MPVRIAPARRTLALSATVLALLALPSLAPAARAQSADEKALASYRLTMPTIRKLVAVQEKIMEVAASPDAKKWAKELERQSSGNATIAELSAAYDRVPPLKQAIASSGLSTREYVTAFFSFFQAAMMVSVQEYAQQQGSKEAAPLPAGVSKENVELVRQNKAEIDQISKRLQEMQKKMNALEESEDESGGEESQDPR